MTYLDTNIEFFHHYAEMSENLAFKKETSNQFKKEFLDMIIVPFKTLDEFQDL